MQTAESTLTFFWQLLYWTSVAALLQPYIIYPTLTKLIAKTKAKKSPPKYSNHFTPTVSVFIPVFNEKAVIKEKVASVLDSDYPLGKIEILVGSDASDDGTDEIVSEMEKEHPQVKLCRFNVRRGKAAVINSLAELTKAEVFVITDADTFFARDTIGGLVGLMQDDSIGLVESKLKYKRLAGENTAMAENRYIELQTGLKEAEGLAYGTMLTPFGSCFAMRSKLFKAVPENSLGDDFYLAMRVLESGSKSIVAPSTFVYQDLFHGAREEFRRKVRIGAGNFQNLVIFFPLLFRFNALSFSFFSHKVLRWFGPISLLCAYISAWQLMLTANNLWFYALSFYGETALFMLPIIGLLLGRLKMKPPLIGYFNHFLLANASLLAGLFSFLFKKSSGVWKPTERVQAGEEHGAK